MEIVILDGYTLNPGDLTWESFEKMGNLTVYDRSKPSQVIERAEKADAIITNKVPLEAETLKQLPKLQYIGVSATGYDIVDIATATDLDITVTNVPDYGTSAVAQHTFALIMEVSNGVGQHHLGVKKGNWQKSADWCYWERPIFELAGKTLGIVGFGKIGKAVAKIAQGFGMQVIAYNRSAFKAEGVEAVSLTTVFAKSDIISLHCPLTPENKGFVNSKLLSKTKKGAILINTARGGLINESALAASLQNGNLHAAALDVLSEEPPTGSTLIKLTNCYITPHQAWCAYESRKRLLDITFKNLKSFIEGGQLNTVN